MVHPQRTKPLPTIHHYNDQLLTLITNIFENVQSLNCVGEEYNIKGKNFE